MRPVVIHLGVAVAAGLAGYAIAESRHPQTSPRDAVIGEPARNAAIAASAPAVDAAQREECRVIARDNDELREQLRRARTTTRTNDVQYRPTPGPEPVDPFGEAPPEYRESVFSDHIRGVFAELGISGELDIDCSEFPCLAALRDHKMTKAEEDAVLAKLRARGYGDEAKAMLRRHASVGPGGKAYLNVVAFYPGDREGELEEILASRVEEQLAITRASVATPPE